MKYIEKMTIEKLDDKICTLILTIPVILIITLIFMAVGNKIIYWSLIGIGFVIFFITVYLECVVRKRRKEFLRDFYD